MYCNLKNPKKILKTATLFLGLIFPVLLVFACQRNTRPEDLVTNRDVIRFLIRSNPDFFSNSFLDTTSWSIAGTDISFSRSFSIKTQDTFIIINSQDTVNNVVVARNPPDAGADLLDSLIGNIRSTDGNGIHNRSLRIPITKFGYFQNINPPSVLLGWVIWNVSQTYVGNAGLIDSVRLRAPNSSKDTLFRRVPRSSDPENDPQQVQTLAAPFRLEADDSVYLDVWIRLSIQETLYHVFCHISDTSPLRRVQLTPDSTRRKFSGQFKLSHSSGDSNNRRFRRLIIDIIGEGGLRNPSVGLRNEMWGILYQVVPPNFIP